MSSHGQAGRGAPPYNEDLEQRLRQTQIGAQWQGGTAVPGPYGAGYPMPYAFAPGFPQQAGGFPQRAQGATGQFAPRAQFRPSSAQRPLGGQAFPTPGQGLALQLQPGFRGPIPQPYAAFYPNFQPAFGYLAPGGPWRPVMSQQMPPAFAQQGQPLQAAYAYPGQPLLPSQGGRPGGRQGRGRGRPGRQQGSARGRGAAQQQHQQHQANQQYRAMWQEVTQVSQGQGWHGAGQQPMQPLTVEDLVAIVQQLPSGTPAVPAVASHIHSLDSRACAAFLKALSQTGLPHHALAIFDWLQSLPPENDLSRLCDVFTYTTDCLCVPPVYYQHCPFCSTFFHPLSSDLPTSTNGTLSLISLCGQRQELDKALTLVADMRGRGIALNIHTYTALINTCIKSGNYSLALDVFDTLKKEGCKPNVVTYNTLIDVFGKMGRWEDAVRVLDDMAAEGWQPETRTYNTAIIACNMCNHSEEALQVYKRMQNRGLQPTDTTYTALVSAYCKSDNLEAALEVYDTMVSKKQDRNIITYSSLIAAADRAGQWDQGLSIWQHMSQDRCHPNLPAFNSAISCSAQGGRWRQAQDVFEQMKAARFKPDMATYTALLAAYHPAHKWRQALQALEQMQAASDKLRPDTAIYAAVIDLLWCTGIVGAQQRAVQLFKLACRQSIAGMEAAQTLSTEEEDCLKVCLVSPVPSIAVLALYKWLQDAHQTLERDGSAFLQQQVLLIVRHYSAAMPSQAASRQGSLHPEEEEAPVITSPRAASSGPEATMAGPSLRADPQDLGTEAGPSSSSPRAGPSTGPDQQPSPGGRQRPAASSLPAVAARIFGPEYTDALNQEAIASMVRGFALPFRFRQDEEEQWSMVTAAEDLVGWLQGPRYDSSMAALVHSLASPSTGLARSPMQANLAFLQQEQSTADNCAKAWKSLRLYESYFGNVVLGADISQQYLEGRPECLALARRLAVSLRLMASNSGDAVLMLDRVVHQMPELYTQDAESELLGACVVLSTRHGLDQPAADVDHSAVAALIDATTGGVTAAVQRLEHALVSLTPEGTQDALTIVSATRCLSMYRERLGALQMEITDLQSVVTSAFASGNFVSVQPSLLAAVAYLGTREQQGLLPAWPRALAELTGWQGADDSTDAFSTVTVKMRAFLQDRQ